MIEPVWIGRQVVEAVHDVLLAEHGGLSGIRDEMLLESALGRSQNLFAYGDAPDLCDLAAAYAHGIIKNHPFADGNKRTGLMAAYIFLERNGVLLTASEADTTRTVLDVASGKMDESGFAAWLRSNTEEN